MWKKNRDVNALIEGLRRVYPRAACALHFKNPLELLVATILSAQCTDERVNKVTPDLFNKYRQAGDYAQAPLPQLEKEVKSTGFYRNKAKSIHGMARMLVDRFGGEVPRSMDELIQLPGVARKTANVVLGTAFGIADGIVVDTHVIRLSERLGLSKEKTPEKIEKDLMAQVSQKDWIWFAHALTTHGRQVCKARNPLCPRCPVRKECPNPVFP
ncbi:MAG: endonuclease III [Elusimicrobia bacterium]|nr:endonuclease III [Candidatus Obscuribacterium magneticum]